MKINHLYQVAVLLLFAAGNAFAQQDASAHRRVQLQALTEAFSGDVEVGEVLDVLPVISEALRDPDAAFEALPLAERALDVLLSQATANGEGATVVPLLKIAARMRYEQAQPDLAAKHLERLLDLYRARPGDEANERTPPRAQVFHEVAVEYLRGEQIGSALEVLGEAVDRQLALPHDFRDQRAAVAGALNRRLEQLDTNERYDVLYAWTMPTGQRNTVRVLESLASVEAPPDVFARAIGERPRPGMFPVPRIGSVDGLFSTAWSLVQAAAESGRLRRLTAELDTLADAGVANAEHLSLLARLADRSRPVEEVRSSIQSALAALRDRRGLTELGGTTDAKAEPANLLGWSVAGAACLERDGLQETGQIIFETMLEMDGGTSVELLWPFLRRARAIAVLKQHANSDLSVLADPKLKYWIPAGGQDAVRSAAGAVREIWLAHENHILHLAGPFNEYLCFRYPLRGDFQFEVEAQYGGSDRTAGNLAFGGLAYGAAGNADEFRVWALDMGPNIARPMPFVREEPWATYQRLSLRSSADGVQHLVNGHPVWTDPLPASTSPWLALRCAGTFVPAFRNFRLTGEPVIPREVPMSDGDVLRGWFASFYPGNVSRQVPLGVEPVAENGGSQRAPQESPPKDEFDWYLRDGVIHGARRGELFRTALQSRLTYFRPLQSGESISYDFLYEPGRYHVHPALGRLAFLIEPNGVRIHWMTSGEVEWTGLSEDNATIEPLNRRGPRTLPLKAEAWNGLTMTLDGDTLALTLNGVEIYSRRMEPENDRRFSLYHDRLVSAVRVRSAVMRGDWPERLSEDARANLVSSGRDE